MSKSFLRNHSVSDFYMMVEYNRKQASFDHGVIYRKNLNALTKGNYFFGYFFQKGLVKSFC